MINQPEVDQAKIDKLIALISKLEDLAPELQYVGMDLGKKAYDLLDLCEERLGTINGSRVESEMEAKYSNSNYKQFVRDMERADLEVSNYRGRFYYEGPSVVVDNIEEVARLTDVKLQWDSMGRDQIVVYPK